MKILIADGDRKLADALGREPEAVYWELHSVADGEAGLEMALEQPFDLILLDWDLPKKTGLTLLKALREHKKPVPILMLTEKDSVKKVILSLGSGADACIAKSSGMQLLQAWIMALMRRPMLERRAEIRCAHIRLDPVGHKVWSGNREVELTVKEYDLLHLFIREPEQVFTRTMIVQKVWGDGSNIVSKGVDVYVSHLREKINIDAATPLIHNVRGVGYVFKRD